MFNGGRGLVFLCSLTSVPLRDLLGVFLLGPLPCLLGASVVVVDLVPGPQMYGSLQSPDFPEPYRPHLELRWNISAPPGFNIHLVFSHFQLEPSYQCQYDYVQVEAQAEVLARFCGEEATDTEEVPAQRIISSPRNSLSLVFSSDFSNEQRYSGFKAHYSAADVDECSSHAHLCDHHCHNYIGGFYCSCRHGFQLHSDNHTCTVQCSSGVFRERSGVLSTVDFPAPYPKNSNCSYVIEVEVGFTLKLEFDDNFDVEDHPEVICPYDFLQVSTGSSVFGPFCGQVSPGIILTESNSATIIFHSDQSGENRGWRLRYTATGSRCVVPVAIPHILLQPIQSEYFFKDHLVLTCEPGYHLLHDGEVVSHYQIFCGSNGSWTERLPHCQLVDCGSPAEVALADVVFGNHDNSTSFGSTVVYVCRDNGGQPSNHSFTCSANGDWTDAKGRSQVPSCQRVCGYSSRPLHRQVKRVVGGRGSVPGQFPWQVLISVEDLTRVPEGRWFGSGSLLSGSWVLTAAHVLLSPRRDAAVVAVDPRHVMVFLGLHDVRLKEEAERHPVQRVLLHPRFSPLTYQHDIALLRLSREVTFSREVGPVCLPRFHNQDPDPLPASLGLVAGWGIWNPNVSSNPVHQMALVHPTDPDGRAASVHPALPIDPDHPRDPAHAGRTADVLQFVQLPVVQQDECVASYASRSTAYVVTDHMFCAGFLEGGHDSCLGDSGGAFVQQDRGTRRWVVYGVVSWGGPEDCGSRRVYGVYTRISKYLDWIQNHLSSLATE